MYDELVKRLRNEAETERYLLPHSDNGTAALLDEAADAIEELIKHEADMSHNMAALSLRVLRAEEKTPRWIPVTERLPEKTGKYLVCGRWRGNPTEIWVCEFMTLGYLKGWANNAANPIVTHWMPLPEPPTKEEGET